MQLALSTSLHCRSVKNTFLWSALSLSVMISNWFQCLFVPGQSQPQILLGNQRTEYLTQNGFAYEFLVY